MGTSGLREELIPNAPPEDMLVARDPMTRAHSGIRVLMAGQLSAHKGVHIALAAAIRCGEYKWDGVVEFAGSGPLDTLVRGVASQPSSGVHFHGHVKRTELARLFDDVDAVIVPSLWPENSPMVLQEAAARGCAIIASEVGGVREAVSLLPESTWTLVQPANRDALAQAILRVKPKSADQVVLGLQWGHTRRAAFIQQYAALIGEIASACS